MKTNSIRQEVRNAGKTAKIYQLELVKTIYPSRVKKTSDMIKKIIALAIESHLDKNPELEFKKCFPPVRNDDKTLTYRIEFKLKNLY